MTPPLDTKPRLTRGLILLLLLSTFSFAAIVKIAAADHYHTTCVAHGFVHGESTSDGSFFSRVYAGCGSTSRLCDIYSSGSYLGGQWVVDGSSTCNAWSRSYSSSATECASYANVYSAGVFSTHNHLAHNWCL